MQILHTMLRVADLEKSLEFYTHFMGMNLLKHKEYPSGRFTLAFVGYQSEYKDGDRSTIELTYNWDTNSYDHGDAFGHIAIAVDDVSVFVKKCHESGVEVTTEPKSLVEGATIFAFIKDPDGYKIELIQR
jgi:lactoylglutathione lyase